ncbi:MAG TPA: cupin domain-containing protein, partial [Gaiellaceae bacterium]
MVPEAPMQETEHGLAPGGEGWFVLNAKEGRWRHREGRGDSITFTGSTDFEAENWFPQLGVNLNVLAPGEPMAMYHWEADQEAYFVLAGEALLLVEGQERPLRQWDYFHSPPGTNHMIVGAGDGPCVFIAIGSREHMATPEWGGYTVDEVALRHDAGVEKETTDADEAYARFP